MHILPPAMILLIRPFAPLFSKRVWLHVQVLLAGAILTPAHRTVAAALRVVGLGDSPHVQRYHRVLNRASGSSLAASRVLLRLLVAAFVPNGPLVVGVDETLARRTGAQIAAKGVSRDAVRSSHSHFVKATGLRWVSLMLLAPIPWAGRVGALPFLTALAPSERDATRQGRRHKALTDWAWQLLVVVRRWWPERAIVAVAESGDAAMRLLARCIALPVPITMITRLRRDAALYEPAPPRYPGQSGRPRQKGKRWPTLAARATDPATRWQAVTVADWYGTGARVIALASETAIWYHTGLPPVPIRWVLIRDPQERFATQALLCTDLAVTPRQIIAWVVRRWQMEATFEEARRHLGVETQRQWTALAIRRTTPALPGLFSLVTLLAHPHLREASGPIRQAAWYRKRTPTVADALAVVRREIGTHATFRMSSEGAEMVQVPRALVERFTETLCYVA
ncbi:MAG: IS701 family transposase [Thermomicrobiales bacterium]